MTAVESEVAQPLGFYRRESSGPVAPGSAIIRTTSCDSGDVLTGGRFSTLGGAYGAGMSGEHILSSGPTDGAEAWSVTLYNDTHNTLWNVDILLTVWVMCAER